MKGVKIIILNGPPRVGKDTLLSLLLEKYKDSGIELLPFSYKWTLCEDVAVRYGLTPKYVWNVNADPDTKDEPSIAFFGISVRQALIHESENVIKVAEGEAGVAIRTFKRLDQTYGREELEKKILITADGGFNVETQAALDYFGIGRENMFIVRIDRPDHSFERFNDSREYLNDPNIVICNDGSFSDLLEEAIAIDHFIKEI